MNQKKWVQVIAIIVILLSANLTVTSTSFDESLIDDQKQKRVTEIEPNDSSFDTFDQRISWLMKLAGFPSLSACIRSGRQNPHRFHPPHHRTCGPRIRRFRKTSHDQSIAHANEIILIH